MFVFPTLKTCPPSTNFLQVFRQFSNRQYRQTNNDLHWMLVRGTVFYLRQWQVHTFPSLHPKMPGENFLSADALHFAAWQTTRYRSSAQQALTHKVLPGTHRPAPRTQQ